jgi:hypothetical protein
MESPPLIQWRAVFGGVIVGLALFVLLATAWLAASAGSSTSTIRTNLAWWLGGSAIFSMFIAGFVAAMLGGMRTLGSGIMHSLTVWGLTIVAGLFAGLPVVMRLFNIATPAATTATAGTPATLTIVAGANWPTFWSMLIGLGAALIGGVLGGLMPRRRAMMAPMQVVPHEHRGSEVIIPPDIRRAG